MRHKHHLAARLAGVGAFGIVHAGKPDGYGAMYTDQM
jgi:predicted PilT family ATPase